jgi:hypothetical protein
MLYIADAYIIYTNQSKTAPDIAVCFPLSEEFELWCMYPRTITVHCGQSELRHRLSFYPPEHPNVHDILYRD